uniref:Uncharacterized protein n=1 Tax=Romanomermis culicivorax TaxID=13658 RepID=A0A915I9J4_ROMCU
MKTRGKEADLKILKLEFAEQICVTLIPCRVIPFNLYFANSLGNYRLPIFQTVTVKKFRIVIIGSGKIEIPLLIMVMEKRRQIFARISFGRQIFVTLVNGDQSENVKHQDAQG